MSARVERAVAVRKTRPAETVKDFSPEQLQAPFLLRCGAVFADYILLVSVPVVSLLLGRFSGEDGVKLLNGEINNVGWMITILIGISNLIIFPMLGGQTLGKMCTGLRIVRKNGSAASVGNILRRHVLGYLLTVLTLGIGFFISVLTRHGRALHDYVGGTMVIYANRRVVK